LAAALEAVGPGVFTVDVEAGTLTRSTAAAWIDTGAFGKGAALRGAARRLRQYDVDRALLDLGGQILALAEPGEEPWTVAVAHPSHRDQPAAWLRLAGVSAATSGNSERGITVDGRRLGHILDPRTGEPAPSWGSVTLVSADPLVADILSTALYVMGPVDGLAWADRLADVGVLFLVDTGGEIQTLHNQAMTRWLSEEPASAGSHDPSSPERRLP
jgi:thiamine biosynthesis lipoprotein